MELDRNFGNVKRVFLEKVERAIKEEKSTQKRKLLLQVKKRGSELLSGGEGSEV